MRAERDPSHRSPFRRVKPPKKRSVGRPPKPVDRKRVAYLSERHCPVDEIAVLMDVNPETLYTKYHHELNLGKARGNLRVREDQYNASRKGCPQAFIHLGKHWLAQREVIEVKEAHKDDIKSLLSGLHREFDGSKSVDPADAAAPN